MLATSVHCLYSVVLLFRVTNYLLFTAVQFFDALKQWNMDLNIFKWIKHMHCLRLYNTKEKNYSWHGNISCWRAAKEKLAVLAIFIIVTLILFVPLIEHQHLLRILARPSSRCKLFVYEQYHSFENQYLFVYFSVSAGNTLALPPFIYIVSNSNSVQKASTGAMCFRFMWVWTAAQARLCTHPLQTAEFALGMRLQHSEQRQYLLKLKVTAALRVFLLTANTGSQSKPGMLAESFSEAPGRCYT